MAFQFNALTGNLDLVNSGGSGDVVGPSGGSTDNAIARFNGTTGHAIQDSLVTIDDSGNVITPGDVDAATVTLPDGDVQTQLDDKASIRLDNLGTTSINSSLLFDSDGTHDVGSPSEQVAGLFAQTGDFTTGINTEDFEATGGTLLAALDMQGNPIENVADPTTAQQAATKAYADLKIPLTQKAAANGVATLDGGGKIPANQLPNSVLEFQGFWNANTNTPTLTNGTGTAGYVYEATVAGTTNFGAGPITFAVGDYAIFTAAGGVWEKSINSNAVLTVNTLTGNVVLTTTNIAEGSNLYYTTTRFDTALATKTTDNLTEGSTNLYATDERAQDAVGTILADTSSIDLTYSDATPSISGVVLPAGVNHDALQNYVANQHVDHTTVQIATAAGTSGLSGGGTIAATRNIVVDIHGTTLKGLPINADELMIWDSVAVANKRVTKSSLFTGYLAASAGDLAEGSFSSANNQSSAADVTGFAFANGTVRGFDATVTVFIDATSDLFEEFKLQGIQKGSLWEMTTTSVGDDSGITFSITTSGQIQYTSTNVSGFTLGTIKYRAQTLSV